MLEINFSESRELFEAIDETIASEGFSELSSDEKLSTLRGISQTVGRDVIGLPENNGLGYHRWPDGCFPARFFAWSEVPLDL